MSQLSVAVSGATGYAGGEILRLLSAHPNLHVTTVCGHASAGDRLADHQPHLRAFAHLTIEPSTAQVLAGHDVVVLALPHGASGQIAAELADSSPDTLIVDLAADHRLMSARAWEAFYGSPHPGTWTYGLPEMLLADGSRQREALRATRRIAVPGCNVTAVTLGLGPLLQAGLIEPTGLTAVLANGVSGAGKALKPHLTAAEVLGNASPYGVGGTHRHVPEIEQNLNLAFGSDPEDGPVRISFTPTLIPASRGILATLTAIPSRAISRDAVAEVYEAAYAAEPFVRVLGAGVWPQLAAVAGTNVADLQFAVDERAGRLVVVVALDNLVRGTAGQALQSAHLALGLEEATALPVTGIAP